MPYTWSYQDVWKAVVKAPLVPKLTGAELLWLRFRTEPEVVHAILPRPLRVPDDPLATAIVASYHETSFGPPYREAILSLDATYRGELGSYIVAIPVTDDMAMASGREIYGFPKKLAEIELVRRDHHAIGTVVRHGVEILRLEGELLDDTGQDAEALGMKAWGLDREPARKMVSWLFKYSHAADGSAFEHAPLLVREAVLFTPHDGQRRAALHLKLVSSPTDPLGEIPLVEAVDAGYGHFDVAMLPGRVVHKVRNPLPFLRRALWRLDSFAQMDFEAIPSHTFADRRRLRRQLSQY